MRNILLRSAPLHVSLAALAACLASSPVLAQTTVSSATTTPLATSSAGDITVTGGGSINLTSGTAITIDSDRNVGNAGNITVVSPTDGGTGILIRGGRTSAITNDGTIAVAEVYVRSDTNAPVASGSNRFGIRLDAGGTLNGSITNSGTVTAEGKNSAAIALDSTLNGSFLTKGQVGVIGENSFGIRMGAVTGTVTIGGTVNAIGQGASAVGIFGNIGGSLGLTGIAQQVISYVNDNGGNETLLSGAINVGAPAAWVAGSVAGGILVDTTAVIQSAGNGPALLIGGTGNIGVGPLAGNADGASLVVAGKMAGVATYNGLVANALVLGGKGGAVNLPGGISVTGNITAAGSNSGGTAVLINSGVNVPKLVNSGVIATTTITAGTTASPITHYAIRDLSGGLSLIQNSGLIGTGGSTTDTRRAIDLSANTSGVTITQYLSSASSVPQIQGDILSGSGDDTLAFSAGTVTGNVTFGAGNDRLILSDAGSMTGNVNFGTGVGTLALIGAGKLTGAVEYGGAPGSITVADSAAFTGTVANGGAVTVAVNGGRFAANAAATMPLASLSVGAGGTLGVYIDTTSQTSSRFVVGNASFASGAKVTATLSSLVNAAGSYTVLSANNLSGAAGIDSTALGLPFIYNGTLASAANAITLTISRKTAAQLGLNRAQAAGYDAILTAGAADKNLSTTLYGVADAGTLKTQLGQLLPDHSGGVFDVLTRASRLAAQHVMDADSFYSISSYGGWLEPIYWRASQDGTDVASYSDSGWGLTIGVEKQMGIGRVGLSYSFLRGSVTNNGGTGKVKASQNEFSLFWRRQDGPLYLFARASAAPLSMSGTRTFDGSGASTAFTYQSNGKWSGWLFSATGGASFDANIGERFTLRPKGVIDYYRLQENSYAETGTSKAMNLEVASRRSSAVSATGTITAVYRLGRPAPESRPLSFTLEAGRRNVLSGDLGNTTANFVGAAPFTITPEKLRNAWLGEAGLFLGGLDFTFKVAGRAERIAGQMNYSGRISFSGAF